MYCLPAGFSGGMLGALGGGMATVPCSSAGHAARSFICGQLAPSAPSRCDRSHQTSRHFSPPTLSCPGSLPRITTDGRMRPAPASMAHRTHVWRRFRALSVVEKPGCQLCGLRFTRS